MVQFKELHEKIDGLVNRQQQLSNQLDTKINECTNKIEIVEKDFQEILNKTTTTVNDKINTVAETVANELSKKTRYIEENLESSNQKIANLENSFQKVS